LTPPIGVAKTQGLNANTLEGFAILIHNAPSDCTQWNKPERDVVKLLSLSQGQICSFTGRRQSSIDLPSKPVAFHPQTICSGSQLKSEMTFHIRVSADRRSPGVRGGPDVNYVGVLDWGS
jgi:hypothetical protein